MSNKNHRKGGPGSRPSKRPRFESIAAAINRQLPEAAARVIDDTRGNLVIAVRVNDVLEAWFRGWHSTWRAHIARIGAEGQPVETKNLLYATGLMAYKEKNVEAVASAIISSLKGNRAEIELYDLLERVAVRVNELRPASGAKVRADSPGVYFVAIIIDEKHEAHFAKDYTWGCHLMKGRGGKADYANQSITLELSPDETDVEKLAAAGVKAAADLTPR